MSWREFLEYVTQGLLFGLGLGIFPLALIMFVRFVETWFFGGKE